MVWRHQGKDIPLELYHGIPSGWSADEITAEHRRLGGTDDVAVGYVEGVRPAWLPLRSDWLRYRESLYRIADGVVSGDDACIELAIRFIELRYIGSYSGFVREKLARRLKVAALRPEHRARLHRHFTALALSGEHTQEFRDYVKLWRQIVSVEEIDEVIASVRAARGIAAADWLVAKLRQSPVS